MNLDILFLYLLINFIKLKNNLNLNIFKIRLWKN